MFINNFSRPKMTKYPKIRKPESNKDTWFFIRFYLITALLVAIAVLFLIWVISSLSLTYKKGLNECTSNGYSREYCEMMLN